MAMRITQEQDCQEQERKYRRLKVLLVGAILILLFGVISQAVCAEAKCSAQEHFQRSGSLLVAWALICALFVVPKLTDEYENWMAYSIVYAVASLNSSTNESDGDIPQTQSSINMESMAKQLAKQKQIQIKWWLLAETGVVILGTIIWGYGDLYWAIFWATE